MMRSLLLRVLSVVLLGMAVVVTLSAFDQPLKPWTDIIARMVLWPALAFISWILADVAEPLGAVITLHGRQTYDPREQETLDCCAPK